MKNENGHQDPSRQGATAAPELSGTVSGTVLDDQHLLTVEEVCRVCSVQVEYIEELVEEGLITPQVEQVDIARTAEKHERRSWRFTGMHMRQARIAAHLQSDLGVNLAGVALALQLLDEVETLRMRVKALDAI
jgi:chaperone modulatory protein CbpM